MCDDGLRPAHFLGHLLEADVVRARGSRRADRRGAVLHEELGVGGETLERLEQAVEAGLVRPDGDEDHDPETTLPR